MKDDELERELTELLHDAKGWVDALERIEAKHHETLEPHGVAKDSLGAIDKALDLLGHTGKVLALHEPEGLGDLKAMLRRHDELDAFRSRVLGVVKEAGALDMGAQPDDNRLVTLLKALMP